MSNDPARAPVIREGACFHPAARAWRRAGGDRDPGEIRILKKRVNYQIYLLPGVGPGGVALIAKRGSREMVERERRVYTEVLPNLPVPSLAYHGMVDDGGRHCWSFLEFASGDRYSPRRVDHRRLAGEWLGVVHAAGAELPMVEELDGCRPDQFLDSLRFAKGALAALLEWTAAPADAAVLEVTARALEDLEKRWDDVRDVCEAHPATLVHGDFAPRNLRVRGHAGDARLEVFDWVESGSGPPAVDLTHTSDRKFAANPSLEAYRRGFSARGPTPTVELLERFVVVGKIIRSLSAIKWEMQSNLGVRGDKLQAYVDWIREGMQEAGWQRRRAALSNSGP
jgi:Ser/Thr protein kinase RdoA (MazF antagonist)